MLAPFIAELGETKEQLGRVTGERDQARLQAEIATLEREQVQVERDVLQQRLDALEARQRPAQDTTALRAIEPDQTPPTATRRDWWAFWRRS